MALELLGREVEEVGEGNTYGAVVHSAFDELHLGGLHVGHIINSFVGNGDGILFCEIDRGFGICCQILCVDL